MAAKVKQNSCFIDQKTEEKHFIHPKYLQVTA
jgi:hypothetical protein